MKTIELVYGLTGQTVEYYPPLYELLEGVPSSATYAVYAGGASLDGSSEFSGSGTVDSVSTTLTASAGYSQTNRKTVTVSSASSITVGREYLLANAEGQREAVVVAAISGTTITLEQDLAYDYASGATFKGVRMVFTADSTWVATESKINTFTPASGYGLAGTLGGGSLSYKVVWSYTVNSVVRRAYQYLRLVRQIPKSNVTPRDLIEKYPHLLEEEDSELRGQKFAYAIDAAWEALRADFLAEGYRIEQVRDTELVDELHRNKTLHVIAKQGKAPGSRDVESFIVETRDEYTALFGKVVSSLKIPIDQGTEGNATPEPIQTYFFNR